MARKRTSPRKTLFRRKGKPKLDDKRVASKRLVIKNKEYMVYKCGNEVVVYNGDKEVYNSVIDKMSFDEWRRGKRRFKLFNR